MTIILFALAVYVWIVFTVTQVHLGPKPPHHDPLGGPPPHNGPLGPSPPHLGPPEPPPLHYDPLETPPLPHLLPSKRHSEPKERPKILFDMHHNPKCFKIYIAISLLLLFIISAVIGPSYKVLTTILVFLITTIVIFIRPRGMNEAYPAAVGAAVVLLAGAVTYPNLVDITEKVRGASLTIIATIVMAVTLESFGFFHWTASKLAKLAKGSGYHLYWYIQLLCFLATLLFNNDGSILITTPILILLLRNMQLKPHEQIPYLLSGALIATGSSTPIGVSNITNLIALNIVHMTLYRHTEMMFVPGTTGLLLMSLLMFLLLKKRLPRRLPAIDKDLEVVFFSEQFHPVKKTKAFTTASKRTSFMLLVLTFVFGIRCLLFVASYFQIPIEFVAIIGSLVLLVWRWSYLRTSPIDILKKTPWHILVFAFSMYVIIYGLNNIGLTRELVKLCEPIVTQGLFNASFMMGGLISVLSNIFNNHPALMVGTITLTNMGLDPITLKTIYLANIIGSDMGSLLLPIGTLASLMWMYILKQNKIKVTWREYIRLTITVIPITVVFTLWILYFWIQTVFA